ncbi:MAG: class I SAM-dependent methyltransferase, partial [Lachnospiraceae bacterium]|nr:class I SAM-dependent methyltransferase [Lachnospiraceae bacterium]
MEAYTDFAGVYDTFMDETPYEEWCEFLDAALTRYRIKEETADTMLLQEQNSVVDLGCGTGTLTELLAAKGYDMIGIDNSQEMLQIAMEKRARSGLDILYLQQDMREFELYGAVGAVISVCDSLNYLLTEEELLSTFLLVHNYLYPGGVFIFDFNTVYK